VVNKEEAGVRDRVTGVRRDRRGEDVLNELVSLEAIKDVFVELTGIDYLKCLIDYQF
jgi:hypothetical protein